jgi:CRISPR-associated endonuclease/helicase Cas3
MPPVLAKTNGITLQEHTRHVVEQGRAWLDAFPFLEEKYETQTGEALRPRLLRAAKVHDQGKSHPTWQNACRKDAREGGGTNLMQAQLRHELASLDWAKKKGVDLSLPEKAAVAAHHGKLSYRHKHRWHEDANGQFKDLWDEFYGCSQRWTFNVPDDLTEQALNERFRIAGVRALLQLADTRASIQENENEAQNWVPDPQELQFSYTFPYENDDGTPSYRGVQEAVQNGWDEPMMILRAPTGSGKTDASLLWAQHQINKGRADRCVIAMPTRFTSNSLSIDVDKNVSKTGLYHSSAWYARHKEDAEVSPGKKHRAQEMHRMARLLATPVTVCTIDHLCIALTGTREDHHSIFYHLCNSCVVIDEADFYDPFVQANLQMLLRVLRQFDVPVLVMSATVPDAAKDFYSIGTLAEDTSDLDRVRCTIKDAGEAETPNDVATVLQPIVESVAPTAIVYANTVKRALAYYDWFCDRGVEPILYHSRFTEPHKKEKEGHLLDALGQKAWAESTAAGVAILTQIGEMSLNISAPVMVSDLCPYDRLAQRAGRLGRFDGMEPGTLHVVTPMKDDALYPAPYGEYDREAYEWRPGRPLTETQERLSFGAHSAQDFIDAVDRLYATPDDFAPSNTRIQQNKHRLERHLEQDWLIVNAQEPDEDEGRTDEWMSRDIPPQVTVLTMPPPDRFERYAEYRGFEEEHGVTVPAYQVQQKNRDVRSDLPHLEKIDIYVADDNEKADEAWCSLAYSSTEGLILDQKRERSYRDRSF